MIPHGGGGMEVVQMLYVTVTFGYTYNLFFSGVYSTIFISEIWLQNSTEKIILERTNKHM